MLIRAVDVLLWLLQSAFWTAAGAGKISDIARFAISVSAYQILPDGLVDPFAWSVASAEILSGILIAVPRTRAAGCALALGLLAAFTAAAGNALYHGQFHECGCRLPFLQGTTVGPHLLFRNLVLASWLGFLLYRHTGGRRNSPLARAGAALWENRLRIGQASLILGLVVTTLYQRGINAKLMRDHGAGPGGPFANRQALEIGTKLDSFSGGRIRTGPGPVEPFRVDFGAGGNDRIVILFSASCTACARSAPAWNERFARDGASTPIVGICASDGASTRRFIEVHKIAFPVLNVDPGTWLQFRTSVVPRIVRISPDGVVKEVRERF